MRKYYKERLQALKALAKKIAPSLEVNEILEKMREELRVMIPQAMETCILLLDPEASKYTRPLQCALYDKPMNCVECKRNRPAVQKAIRDEKEVVVNVSHPIVRFDGKKVAIGPEAASPIFVNNDIVAVVNVVAPPGERFSRKDFSSSRTSQRWRVSFCLQPNNDGKRPRKKSALPRCCHIWADLSPVP